MPVPFKVGNTYGSHNNHKGGRPPKEITDKIFSLGAVCLKFMEDTMDTGSPHMKIEVTKIIMSKIAPDLTANVGEGWLEHYDERAKQYIARRIGGDQGLQVITPKVANDSNPRSV